MKEAMTQKETPVQFVDATAEKAAFEMPLASEQSASDLQVTAQKDLARRISDALSQAAMAAANEKYLTGGRGGFVGRHDNRAFSQILRGIVIVFLIVPFFALTLYLAFFASDQYQVETRFAVRTVSTPLGDVLSSFGGASGGQTRSETAIVAKYLTSDTLVRSLEQEIGLRNIYARDGVDFLSRFDPNEPQEDLLSYWKWKTTVSEETSTGLISIKVLAFTPEDAVLISNKLIDRATELVNGLSEKNRQSVLELAQARLDRARESLADIAKQIALVQNNTGVLDTGAQSSAQVKLVSSLELVLAEQQATRISVSKLSSESARIRQLDALIASLKKEIEAQKAKLTGNGSGQTPMSEVMVTFEQLQADQKIARNEFAAAAAAFEDARMGAERQQLYLSVFTRPNLPESATYPKRFQTWLMGMAIASVLTFGLIAIARLVRDNRAV